MLKYKTFHILLLSFIFAVSSMGFIARAEIVPAGHDFHAKTDITENSDIKKADVKSDLLLKKKKHKPRGTEPFVPQVAAVAPTGFLYTVSGAILYLERLITTAVKNNPERGPPAIA